LGLLIHQPESESQKQINQLSDLKNLNPNNQVQFLGRLMRVLRMSSQKSGTPKNFCVAKFEIQIKLIKFINQTMPTDLKTNNWIKKISITN